MYFAEPATPFHVFALCVYFPSLASRRTPLHSSKPNSNRPSPLKPPLACPSLHASSGTLEQLFTQHLLSAHCTLADHHRVKGQLPPVSSTLALASLPTPGRDTSTPELLEEAFLPPLRSGILPSVGGEEEWVAPRAGVSGPEGSSPTTATLRLTRSLSLLSHGFSPLPPAASSLLPPRQRSFSRFLIFSYCSCVSLTTSRLPVLVFPPSHPLPVLLAPRPLPPSLPPRRLSPCLQPSRLFFSPLLPSGLPQSPRRKSGLWCWTRSWSSWKTVKTTVRSKPFSCELAPPGYVTPGP